MREIQPLGKDWPTWQRSTQQGDPKHEDWPAQQGLVHLAETCPNNEVGPCLLITTENVHQFECQRRNSNVKQTEALHTFYVIHNLTQEFMPCNQIIRSFEYFK